MGFELLLTDKKMTRNHESVPSPYRLWFLIPHSTLLPYGSHHSFGSVLPLVVPSFQ